MNLKEYREQDIQDRQLLLQRVVDVLGVEREEIITQSLFATVEMLVTKLENKGETK